MLYTLFPEWLSPLIIPGLPFRWYGMMYILNFIITYQLIKWQGKKMTPLMEDTTSFNLIFSGVIGALIGARLFATLIYDTSGYYLRSPWFILWPFDGQGNFVGLQGMSYHGGLLGAIGGLLFYYYRKLKKQYLYTDVMDNFALAFPLGYTFGRLGNFINGELYGRVTLSPLGIIFPHATPLSGSDPHVLEYATQLSITPDELNMVNLPRHPSQLYESFFEGIFLWGILWFIVRKRAPFSGFATGCYLVGYGIIRFVLEYFRQPDANLNFVIPLSGKANPSWLYLSSWDFTLGQLFCLAMIVIGGLFIYFRYRSTRLQEAMEEMEISDLPRNKRKIRKSLQRR